MVFGAGKGPFTFSVLGENVYSQLGGANDPLATKPHGVVRVLWPEL